MNNDDRCFCELAPLYALDLLDADDRAWVEAQILAAPDLAEELAALEATVHKLPFTAPPQAIAPTLKDRLLQRLDSVNAAPVATSPSVSQPEPLSPFRSLESRGVPRQRASRRVSAWVCFGVGGAIAAIACIALGLENYRLRQTNQAIAARLQTLQQAGNQIYALQGTEKRPNAVGSLVINPQQREAVILVQNLPPLRPDQAYRLWAMPNGAAKPIYCGQFNPPADQITSQWTLPNARCYGAVAQMLITADSANAPPVPAGPLVMQSQS